MFKRYPGPHHWLFAIPIGRKRWMQLWDIARDEITTPAWYRRHLIFTYRYDSIPAQRGCRISEVRFRIGTYYL